MGPHESFCTAMSMMVSQWRGSLHYGRKSLPDIFCHRINDYSTQRTQKPKHQENKQLNQKKVGCRYKHDS